MKILVTGGLGFIGRACVGRLVTMGCQVDVLDSLEPTVHGTAPDVDSYVAPWGSAVAVTIGNVTQADKLDPLLARAEAVIHLASLASVPESTSDPARYCAENVGGTALVCQGIVRRGTTRRFVLASSRAVYGEGPFRCPRCAPSVREGIVRSIEHLARGVWDPVCPSCSTPLEPRPARESSGLHPGSVYGTTKLAQENLSQQILPPAGVGISILRLQNVYGPGQTRRAPDVGVANLLCKKMREGSDIELLEDGLSTRDFVFVDDVVDLLVRAALVGLSKRSCELYNVGSGVATSLFGLTEIIRAATGSRVSVSASGGFRHGDVRHAVAETSRLSASYAWMPTPLGDGIRRTVAWLSRVNPKTFVAPVQRAPRPRLRAQEPRDVSG